MKVIYTPPNNVNLPYMSIGKVYSVKRVSDEKLSWEKYLVRNDEGYDTWVFSLNFVTLEKYREKLLDDILK